MAGFLEILAYISLGIAVVCIIVGTVYVLVRAPRGDKPASERDRQFIQAWIIITQVAFYLGLLALFASMFVT